MVDSDLTEGHCTGQVFSDVKPVPNFIALRNLNIFELERVRNILGLESFIH
jgi:hypothetical protein